MTEIKKPIKAINWNAIDDPFDKEIFDKVVSNFWVPERIPLANDLKSWSNMTEEEKMVTAKVFAGLTLLDTIQGVYGATSLIPDAVTMHEEAVYANFSFMEAFSGDTSLETPDGWKPISEITETDLVKQFDPTTREFSFVKPTIVPSHFSTEVYEITGRQELMTQVVSGGHRLYYERYNEETKVWEPREVLARNFATVDPNNARFVLETEEDTAEYGDLSEYTIRWSAPEQVYCVQVPSTYLLTHHSSSMLPIVSGNCIHAKSYSYIFSTLLNSEEIEDIFRWTEEDYHLQKKGEIIMKYYAGDDPHKRKIASVMLESFLFYSGFYWPLYLSSKAKLTNSADVIRLIIQDESIHGFYIGYKFQQSQNLLPEDVKEEYKEFTYNLLYELYENEIEFTQNIYDSVGRTEDVKKFLNYNANKALMNLGYDPLFSKEQTDASTAVLSSLAPNSGENHDFFSGAGSSYSLGTVEEMTDDDWAF